MISIRLVQTEKEYRAVEDLQCEVWGINDDVEVVPYHLLLTAQENGGLVLGAFHTTPSQESLVGFVFGFVGLTPQGHVKHCSHMAGVTPSYQNQNIGHQLKLAQRQHALAQGIDLVTWTFDPLQSRNAYFNLHKLGVVCRSYRRNLYGNLDDALSGGLPSDRFKAEWHIATNRVANRLAGDRPGLSLATLQGEGIPLLKGELRHGLLCPPVAVPRFGDKRLLVQIPTHFQDIKSSDLSVARNWLEHMRAVFENAFSAGYMVTDHLYENGQSFYLIEKGEMPG
jgi:predicted GNAT superfamily acetyltransferase